MLRAAAAMAPRSGAARRALGLALRALDRPAEAEAELRDAVALDPGDAASCNDLGSLLARQRRLAEALPLFCAAAERDPRCADGPANLCAALGELGRLEEAAEAGRRAVALQPGHANAQANLGASLVRLGCAEEAVAACTAALRASPRHAGARANLGLALTRLGRFKEALAALRASLQLAPGHRDARLGLATTLLLLGRFEEGFAAYEGRPTPPAAPGAPPVWRGEALAGRTIRLEAEQGLGDTIQFVRYLPEVAHRGARVQLVAPAALAPLMRGLPGLDALSAPGAPTLPSDFRCALPSLPHRFGAELGAIPSEVPYLRAEPVAVARWGAALAGLPGRRIGLVWAGNPSHLNDRNRSIPFHRLAPLWAVPGVSWVSLQCGAAAAALEGASIGAVRDVSPALHDFGETAAALMQLDLLVTVDTSVAHLAGALGCPAWVLLPWLPDWRWLLGRGDSPWYPTLRLLRQQRQGDWDGVLRRVADALARGADAGSGTAPHAAAAEIH